MLYFFFEVQKNKNKADIDFVCNHFPCIFTVCAKFPFMFSVMYQTIFSLFCQLYFIPVHIFIHSGRQTLTENSSWNLALSLAHRSSTCCRKDFLLTGLTEERNNTECEKEMYKNSTTICHFLQVYSRLQHATLSMIEHADHCSSYCVNIHNIYAG